MVQRRVVRPRRSAGLQDRVRTKGRRKAFGWPWCDPEPARRAMSAPWVETLEARTLLSALVTTDKGDYAPGMTAVITGGGFTRGETVELHVARTDGIPDAPPGNVPWLVTDGGAGDLDGIADGEIRTTWHVGPDYAGAKLEL